MLKYFYNSLDLDFDVPNFELGLTCSDETATKILNKIVKCNYCVVASKKLSNFKGFHIEFYCTKKCDKCRLQFDDFRRMYMDEDRPKDCKNLVWDVKHGY